MGAGVKIPFIGQAYQNRSIPVSSQRCINWYPELEPGEARNVITLQAVSGIRSFVELPKKPIRGLHFAERLQLIYAVAGDSLYVINRNGVFTDLGVVDGTNGVVIKDNGTQIGIATGLSYWVYDDAQGLDKISDTEGGELIISDISFLDGYFILVVTGTQRFFITGINDARTVSSLDFSSVEGNPDNLVGVLQANRRLWFFGTNSYEVWFNSGASPFPLVRVDGGSANAYGLAGVFAKVLQDSTPYWCSNDGRIYRGSGYSAERISHYGIENSLRTYTTLEDCEACEWTENGHRFVSFSFPSGNETWVFDSTSSMWHQRSSGFKGAIWDAARCTTAWNEPYIGSRVEAKIGILDLDIFTEFGEMMTARRTTPVIHANQNIIFTDRLELVMETGRISGNTDPQARLSWSNNGGVSFGNPVMKSIGELGKYQNKLTWYRLGQAKNRVYDLEITDDVRRTLIDCVAEGEAGPV